MTITDLGGNVLWQDKNGEETIAKIDDEAIVSITIRNISNIEKDAVVTLRHDNSLMLGGSTMITIPPESREVARFKVAMPEKGECKLCASMAEKKK